MPRRIPDATGTASTGGPSDRIAAAVLRAIRTSLNYAQQPFGELLGVSYDTVRAWESGRRSLAKVSSEELWQRQQALILAGAAPDLVSMLDDAIRADLIVRALPQADLATHPLGTLVPGRTLTELLGWPITGTPPRMLRGYDTGKAVQLPAGQRADLVSSLRHTAENAPPDQRGAMLRRQTAYLADLDPASTAWASRNHRTREQTEGWTPDWPVQRSRSISAAVSGNTDALHRFVHEHLGTDQEVVANLTYWAYWTGEIPTTWRSDSQMVTTPLDSWPGNRLLNTITTGLAGSPYRELCAHTLHSLLERKPHLAADPTTRQRLIDVTSSVLDHDDNLLSPTTRSRLNQVHFLVRSYHR